MLKTLNAAVPVLDQMYYTYIKHIFLKPISILLSFVKIDSVC